MKTERNARAMRGVQLPTVMLWLAFAAGFASVGQAQEVAEIVVTASKPNHSANAVALRREMQSDAELAAWKTRMDIMSELGERLSREYRPARVAAGAASQRDQRG